MAAPTSPPSPAREAWLPALAAVLVGLTALVRVADADIFGHVAVGELVLTTGRLPTSDPFSYASEGRFAYAEGLVQALYALVVRAAGFEGLGVAHAASVALVAALAARLAEGRGAVRAALLGLVGLAIYPATTLKPQVVSYLFFGLVLLVVRAVEGGARRALFVLPPLFFVWGLSHRASVLALFVLLGCAAVFALRPDHRRLALPTLGVVGLSALATCANPYGTFALASAADVLTRSSFREVLAEWQPLSLQGLVHDHPGVVALALLAGGERALRRRPLDAELVALVATALLASRAGRLCPFFALAAAAPASRALDGLVAAGLARAADAVRPSVALALLVASSLGAYGKYVLDRVPDGMFGVGVDPAFVPVGLARAVARTPFRGELFHAFDFGSYFLYALRGQHRVLVDGRNDTVYSDAHFRAVLDAQTDRAAYDTLDRRYDFGAAAVRWYGPTSFGGPFLVRNPAYALVHWDDLGALYLRRSHVDPQRLARVEYRTLDLATAFVRAERPVASPEDASFVAEVFRCADASPESARAAFLAALTARTRGLEAPHARYAERLRRLVEARELALPIP